VTVQNRQMSLRALARITGVSQLLDALVLSTGLPCEAQQMTDFGADLLVIGCKTFRRQHQR